ncbi:DUF7660 family protein [Niabella drilacis]|uniref:DUF7660 domain-containing protein n=1 Tax=Niabella drilacis (strain DSM 25811 / CCM 8410 / CCUG 62505 / LMG 26954 / E90) TaxID=1285928 RepID=A0A1G6URB4_NIADE|nr:hypothetical protein [Niabella drilacis]SDD43839.1 hypothetical protein SAMN04487894_10965 [Niabella drilacis]
MGNLIKKVENLNTKEDFIAFLELLIQDLRNNPNEWENKSLESYLEAAASWTEDMDGYYQNNNLPIPQNVNWKVFANILVAAKMYE